MCINRQNTRETGGKELSVSLYFLDGIKYNETITEAGRNASIFYYEETARWAFMARRKSAGRNAAKSAGKGIVNHAAGGMAGSAVKKASGRRKPEQGEQSGEKHCGGCGKYESE